MNAPILGLDGVSVTYGGLKALDGVSFTVTAGDIHAIIGPNGAGKSTLFNAITGFAPLSSGSVTLEGNRLDGARPHVIAKKGLGRTFQNLALFREMTIERNLLLGRHLADRSGWLSNGLALPSAVRSGRSQLQFIRGVAERVGISDLLHLEPNELSYGDQKRVELARAICMKPRIILLDEPVAGMNSSESLVMARTIRDVRKDFGLTVLLVEHDMGMVMSIADRISVLDFGRLIAEGTPAQIQRDPAVIEAYLGGADLTPDVEGAV